MVVGKIMEGAMSMLGFSSRNTRKALRTASAIWVGFAALYSTTSNAAPVSRSAEVSIVPSVACGSMIGRSLASARVLSAKLLVDKNGHTQCEVTAAKQGRPGFLMRATLPSQWAGGVVHGGGGGLDGVLPDEIWGSVQPQAMGLVYLVSNGGHVGTSIRDATGLADDPEAVADYAGRAIGTTDEFGDALIDAYYGHSSRHRYFVGCSMGGVEAFKAATMFPERYDGIVAQAPSPHLDEWVARVGSYAQLTPLTDAKWASVYQAYVNACDGLDGLADGVVNNLGACHFSTAQIPGLTDAERATVQAVTSDLKLKDGTVIYPRLWWGARFNFLKNTTTLGTVWMKQLILRDPNYDPASFDLETVWPRIKAANAGFHFDVPAKDMAAYLKKGKKLVIIVGADDAALSLVDMLKYYKEVAAEAGSAAANMKMYIMPGVSHCGHYPEGPQIRGANTADMVGIIRHWVTDGVPIPGPVAFRQDPLGAPLRSRPLCEIGTYPHYDGKGDPDDQASFSCTAGTEIQPDSSDAG
jgi:pimeloyl-ACP methyl ester carboxylesterase